MEELLSSKSFSWSDFPIVSKESKNENKTSSFDWNDFPKVKEERNIPVENEQPKESWGRVAAQVPRNIAAGLGDVLDLPLMGINYGLNKAGVESQIPYPGHKIAEGIDYLTGGYTSPQTPRERMLESGTRAASSVASGYGLGSKLAGLGIKGLSKVGRGFAKINPITKSNLAATGAGGLAQQVYTEEGGELPGALISGLGADMAVRAALSPFNRRNLATAFKTNPKAIESFQGMGSQPTLGQVSNSPYIKTLENAFKELPGTKLKDIYSKQYETVKDILGPGSQKLAMTELEAGKDIKKGLINYKEKVSDITESLKQKIIDKVEHSGSDLVDVTHSFESFEKMLNKLKTPAAKERLLKSPLGKNYKNLIKHTVGQQNKVPLTDLMEFRTSLFDEISKGEAGSVSKGRLNRLRGTLNDDIKSYMKPIGASTDWNQYNKFYTDYALYRKPHVLLAEEVPHLEAHKIFDSITQGNKIDRPLLEAVYASQNKTGQKEIMDAIIQKMGGDDPHLFTKRFEYQPKETQQILLSPLSDPMKEKFKSVMNTVNIFKEFAKYGNPSRTAVTQAAMKYGPLGAFMGGEYIRSHDIENTIWAGVLSSAVPIALSRGVLTNPKFIKWAYAGSQMSPKRMENHIKGLQGILGRPAYQEIKNAISMEKREQK